MDGLEHYLTPEYEQTAGAKLCCKLLLDEIGSATDPLIVLDRQDLLFITVTIAQALIHLTEQKRRRERKWDTEPAI